MKKIVLILLVAFSAISERATAQIGTLTGTGMAICNQYSFTICPGDTITPFDYGIQNYACDSRNHEDISFTTLGSGWRVEIYSWFFIPTGTGGTLTGVDQFNNPVSFSLLANDNLEPVSYTNILGIDYVQFEINNIPVSSLMDRNTFQISLTALPLSATFTLTTTNGGVQGSSLVAGTHLWTVYSTPNGNAGPYTLIGTFNTASFSVNTGSPCYYVRHEISNGICGETCAAQSVCASDCEVVIKEERINSQLGTDADHNAQTSLTLFPNPTSGNVSFSVETLNDVAFTISIYDITGKEVQLLTGLKTTNKKAMVEWNTASLSKGTYLVKIVTADQQTINQKLIVD
jgi:Secretion system C-terminal sorting domain